MTILAYIYYLITSLRNKLYDKGIFKIRSIENLEIICIGNITVGGTGKTPGVQFFVKKFQKVGKKVAVVSRGYKGKRPYDTYLVSDGRRIFATPKESGDEPYLHAINLKAPIIVSADRYKGCLFAKKHYNVDVVILDDGFQHRKLKRDRDIVLIDATNPFGGGEMLPKGTLREDFKKACTRANEFIITKADLVPEEEVKRIKRYFLQKESKPVSVAKHGVTALCDIDGNRKPLFWIKNERVLIFSGLANPFNFEKTIISLSPEYIERMDYIDHHNFTEKDLMEIKKRAKEVKAKYIITTEKDFVKLDRAWELEEIYILKIEFSMIEDNIFGGKNWK